MNSGLMNPGQIKPGQTNSGALVIRADASVAIGTGHVMRCLALAQAWQDAGGRAVFAVAEVPPAIRARLVAESCEIVTVSATAGTTEDAGQTIALAQKLQSTWIVVDGYQFNADYQRALKAAGLKVLFIDDYGHAPPYSADIVLNQNVCASAELYVDRETQTRLLLGPRYCLLRREFAAWRGWKRKIASTGRRVLVTLGGSDPDNVTENVVRAIWAASEFEATVVVGGSNPHLRKLRELVRDPTSRVRLVENISNMPELIGWADIAVAGAGTTSLEVCFLGLPALLVVLADNQRLVAEELSRRGVAVNLGEGAATEAHILAGQLTKLAASPETRKAMSERAQELVDGRGAERVTAILDEGRAHG